MGHSVVTAIFVENLNILILDSICIFWASLFYSIDPFVSSYLFWSLCLCHLDTRCYTFSSSV
jgi:hypothetical protein